MKNYYVNNNAQSNGDHEVHESGCRYMPSDKKSLGQFSSCSGAVTEAKKHIQNQMVVQHVALIVIKVNYEKKN